MIPLVVYVNLAFLLMMLALGDFGCFAASATDGLSVFVFLSILYSIGIQYVLTSFHWFEVHTCCDGNSLGCLGDGLTFHAEYLQGIGTPSSSLRRYYCPRVLVFVERVDKRVVVTVTICIDSKTSNTSVSKSATDLCACDI